MKAEDFFNPQDEDFIIGIRREIHRHPELKFDLPNTLAIVRRELDAIGVPYTEKYGKSSIVATINPDCKGPCFGIRADMDALPIQEKSGVSFSSEVNNVMHACGHDAHTAMLLGTAKALKRAESLLKCKVLLVFQPCEEGPELGSLPMVEDGLMDEMDFIIALHTWNELEVGNIGLALGDCMSACHSYEVEFFGHSAHSSMPESGSDALAMAVTAYNSINLLMARTVPPLERKTLNFGCLQAGYTHNVMPGYSKIMFCVRYFNTEMDRKLEKEFKLACESAASMFGGTCKVSDPNKGKPVINDEKIGEMVLESSAKLVGKEHTHVIPAQLSSEDFSEYLAVKPGVFIRLGTGNKAAGITQKAHNDDFRIDESSLILGSKLCVQFVIDQSDRAKN